MRTKEVLIDQNSIVYKSAYTGTSESNGISTPTSRALEINVYGTETKERRECTSAFCRSQIGLIANLLRVAGICDANGLSNTTIGASVGAELDG